MKAMSQPKTMDKPKVMETDLRYKKPDKDEIIADWKDKWTTDRGALYEVAKLLVSKPRSAMTKRALKRMLSDVWDLIPETVQLVARKSFPKSTLYGCLKQRLDDERDMHGNVLSHAEGFPNGRVYTGEGR